MDATQVTRFSESLSRCLADPGFLDRFYELFLESDDGIAAKFRHTDFVRQKRALSSSLYVMVMAMEGGAAATGYLEQIARRHARDQLDVAPEMYDQWLSCLLRAAAEYDPRFDAGIEDAWRQAMSFGIEFMRARY